MTRPLLLSWCLGTAVLLTNVVVSGGGSANTVEGDAPECAPANITSTTMNAISETADGSCKVVPWEELSESSRQVYENEGISSQQWNENRWIRTREDAEPLLWQDLCNPVARELLARGWNGNAWDSDDGRKMTFYNEAELDWEELSEDRQDFFQTQERFNRMKSNKYSDLLAPAANFEPRLQTLDLPQVLSLNFDFLKALDLEIGLIESVPDKATEEFVDDVPIGEYITRIQAGGEGHTYAQMEDADTFIEDFWEPVGSKVVKYLRAGLAASELAKNGQYKQEWMKLDDDDFGWALFLGGKGTTTAMHFDTDDFSFLYVVEGRKRVVLLKNSGLINESRFNVSGFYHGSAWTDLNILQPENQPVGTVTFELGPGQGVAIPHRAWHSVENLEHTLAYAIRL